MRALPAREIKALATCKEIKALATCGGGEGKDNRFCHLDGLLHFWCHLPLLLNP